MPCGRNEEKERESGKKQFPTKEPGKTPAIPLLKEMVAVIMFHDFNLMPSKTISGIQRRKDLTPVLRRAVKGRGLTELGR